MTEREPLTEVDMFGIGLLAVVSGIFLAVVVMAIIGPIHHPGQHCIQKTYQDYGKTQFWDCTKWAKND